MSQGSALDIAYDAVADRLQLVLRDGSATVGLWLTRRFVKAFLGRFTDTLESSVGGDGEPRAAVIFEHLDALGTAGGETREAGRKRSAGGDGASGSAQGDWPDADAFTIAVKVNVRARDDRFDLTLVDTAERERRVRLTRAESHRLLSAVARKAQAAGWDLEPHMSWLGEAGSARAHALSAARTAH